MICGLLGEKLGHSFSPQIHSQLGDYSYTLMPKAREELDDFIRSGEFDGLNVTIPYKQDVMKHCAALSPEAESIGAVNTLVFRDGGLYGHNTDIFGFKYMVRRRGIDFSGKKVLILGSGGTSRTATAAAKELGAAEILIVSRTGTVNYENVYDHTDAGIIVNTTPLGMFPNNHTKAVDLSRFENISGVVDVVYNPLKTALILQAEELGIPCTGGLVMLVAQAKESAELFMNKAISDDVVEEIYAGLLKELQNIVLVGMPGCGKSTIGKILAQNLGKNFVDADDEIVKAAGMDITTIFDRQGEEGFRKIESQVLLELGAHTGQIIATGGGCVTREENYAPLAQNGLIVHIHRDPSLLTKKGRPLSLKNDLNEMHAKRLPMYRRFGELTVENNGVFADAAEKLLEVLK